MMLIAANDKAALRRFGWQMAIAWPLLFGLLLPWLFSHSLPLWPWLLSALFALTALTVPKALYWPARLWAGFAAKMGWINTRLLLGLVFFLLIWPLGLVLRSLNKLDYRARPASGDSYWRKSAPIASDNMKEPF